MGSALMPSSHHLSLLLILVIHARRISSDDPPLQKPAPHHLKRQPDCELTRGDWCQAYHRQPPQPARSPPSGSNRCPEQCSGIGTCDADTGTCACPAGWGGPGCSIPRKRPCFNMGTNKLDLGWRDKATWAWSRCSGICDDDIAMCYCPPGTKYGHIPAPEGSPPGTLPVQIGRPLYNCNPKEDVNGNLVSWGANNYSSIFGPKGWCEMEKPEFTCPCRIDGLFGEHCDIPVEHSCINQCSGHGECILGFCRCHEGHYGVECGQRREGVKPSPGLEETSRPWLRDQISVVPAALPLEALPSPQRLRPYIYVYNLPPEFNADLLQYRIERGFCSYKGFMPGNRTDWTGATYSIESVMHESMLLSPHRTLDPEEADFFYVPVYSTCLFHLAGKSDLPRWPVDSPARETANTPRPMQAHNMILAAQRWIAATHPHLWTRRGGRDHVWLMAHDEGACYAPAVIWPGVLLSHWGRTEFPHQSLSQYQADDYSLDILRPWQPQGWVNMSSRAHPCFDPSKERTIFLFFKGDVGRERTKNGDTSCRYSRCIRQTLDRLVLENGWRDKHQVWYGDRTDIKGDYSQLMATSIFCLALPGDGWSSRFEEAILHGCIPVVIMDNISAPFEDILDTSAFSVRIAQADMPNIITLLKGIPKHRVQTMQGWISRIWTRFRYNGFAMARVSAVDIERHQLGERRHESPGNDPTPVPGSEGLHVPEDAVSTMMQWLHGRREAEGTS